MRDRKIIVNANIITMDAEDHRCRALAIENGRVVETGSEAAMAPFFEQGWPREDLGGGTALPGFIDTHQHLMLTGSQETAVHLDDAKNIDDIRARRANGNGELGSR